MNYFDSLTETPDHQNFIASDDDWHQAEMGAFGGLKGALVVVRRRSGAVDKCERVGYGNADREFWDDSDGHKNNILEWRWPTRGEFTRYCELAELSVEVLRKFDAAIDQFREESVGDAARNEGYPGLIPCMLAGYTTPNAKGVASGAHGDRRTLRLLCAGLAIEL